MPAPIRTAGINHPALFGSSYERTVDFYTRILGMRLVLEQPNMDDPERSVHLFFEAGPGQFIAYFVPAKGHEGRAPRPERGLLGHIALNLVTPVDEAKAAIEAEGIRVRGPIDRGYERSIYFRDPNGVAIELLSWLRPIPAGVDEGDLILAAQARRIARGARWIELEDVEAIIPGNE
jgi:catechol 2,3-dioxygenase-like lactoylglutathione lyase family enzyme